jgi:hypothetical protein
VSESPRAHASAWRGERRWGSDEDESGPTTLDEHAHAADPVAHDVVSQAAKKKCKDERDGGPFSHTLSDAEISAAEHHAIVKSAM